MYKANNVVNLATKATKIRGKSHRSKNLNYSQWKKRTKMLLHTQQHSTKNCIFKLANIKKSSRIF